MPGCQEKLPGKLKAKTQQEEKEQASEPDIAECWNDHTVNLKQL